MMDKEDKSTAEQCLALATRVNQVALDKAVEDNTKHYKPLLEDVPIISTPRSRVDSAMRQRRNTGEPVNFTRKDLARNFAESTIRSAHALKEKIERETPDAHLSIEEILNTKEFLMECAVAFGNAIGRKGVYRQYCVPTRIVKTRKLIKMARPIFTTTYAIQQTAFYEGYNQMLSQLKNYEWTFTYE